MGHDPVQHLTDSGVTVAWARDMDYAAVYVPAQQIMVLNSQCPREELASAISSVLPETHPRR